MKKIYKKEEGVSPVIATILMVAITVVLAATVWLLVSGYLGGTSQPSLTASLTYDTQQSNPDSGVVYLTVAMSNPSTVDTSKVTVTVNYNGNVNNINFEDIGDTNSGKAGASDAPSGWTVEILDQDGNGKLSSGDIIHIDAGSSNDLSGATVTLSVTGYTGTTPAVTIP